MNLKECIVCNIGYLDKYNFCTKCGEKLKKIKTCIGCETKLNVKDKFCPKCGKQFIRDDLTLEKVKDSIHVNNQVNRKGLLVGLSIFLVIIFLVVLIANLGNSTSNSQNYPTCMKWGLGFQVSDGWGWGRPDGKVGYCILPNSNEIIYSNVGSVS